MTPKLSIVIPVFNEARYIKGCLESLSHQSLLPHEIILVDDGSTDDTLPIVNSLKIKNLKLKIFRQQHHGAGSARNLGAKQATGDILVFVDADMEFDQDFLKNLTAPIRLSQSHGTFSKDEYVKNWDNSWARAWSYCLGFTDKRLIPKHYIVAPVFRSILKSEFDRVGGFDETRGYDDDWSLFEKLGYQAIAASDAVYYHYNPDSFREIFRQARWRATRKYKLGIIGKIITTFKTQLIIFHSPFDPISYLGKIAFITGTQIGLFFSKISK